MPCKPTEAIRRKIQHGVSKTTFHGVMIYGGYYYSTYFGKKNVRTFS